MKQFSNNYIFIFSSVMVVIVAVLLSLAATLLQPRQEKNLELEKKISILQSINVPSTPEDTEELYDKYITDSYVLNSKGEKVDGVDAFTVVLKVEQRKPLEQQYLPVLNAVPEDGEKVIIIPVEGKGLWGPIWGYIALESDMNTIYGVTFDHKGETPGLGAEINLYPFESMFHGKKIFEDDKFVSVKVIKGGTTDDNPHGVDAISGGTITSKGLEKMIFDSMIKYNDFLLKNRN